VEDREQDPEKMFEVAYPNILERYREDYEQDPPPPRRPAELDRKMPDMEFDVE